MPPIPSWSSRLVLALLALQLASACDPNPPPVTPPADTTAPSTRITPQGGTFKDHVSVTLVCDDGAGRGCDATYYTTDGSTPTASSPRYLAAVSLTQNTTVKFFSTDKAGNAEAVQSQAFVVDSVAPTITATPAGGLYNATRSVVLACTDGTGSGCAATYYTLDGSTPSTSSPVYSAAISISASTTLKFFSVDTAGNAESVQVAAYTIDTSAPSVSASPLGGIFRTAQSVTSVDTAGNAETAKSETYSFVNPADISADIASIRGQPDGVINEPVAYALVTYTKVRAGGHVRYRLGPPGPAHHLHAGGGHALQGDGGFQREGEYMDGAFEDTTLDGDPAQVFDSRKRGRVAP